MAKQYQWRAVSIIEPATTLSHGVSPTTYENWQTATVGEVTSKTWDYYYRDSNTYQNPSAQHPEGGFYDDISTQVVTRVTQSWTANIDSRNVLTIVLTTTVGPIVRNDKQGNDQSTPGRQIRVENSSGGIIISTITDNDVATAHTIYSEATTVTETITLQPGSNQKKISVYIHNQTVGSSSFDKISAGVQFMNPLPADYRPGSTLKTDNPYYPGDQTGVWLSHNRSDGAAHVLADVGNVTWQEMRTIDGDNGGQGNPPLILHQADANSWYNQKLLGKD